MCSTERCRHSQSRRPCTPRCWRGSIGWPRCGWWRRPAPRLDANSPTRCCAPSPEYPRSELQAALARLVGSELVFQRGTPPDAVYSFKHALVQDAAHGSLLRDARQQLHAQIAEALATHSPELMDNQPELFAQHYAEAGLIDKSVASWGKAGHRSAALSAMAEAAAQFQKALDQLALLPDDLEHQRQELELCTALGAVLLGVKGPSAPEMGHAYARARELWEQLGSPSEFLQIPYGQARYHLYRGELDVGAALGRGFAASEPSTQRFRWARSRALLLRSKPYACR